MKIAVGVDGNTIARHFGHSDDFQVFTVENNQIVSVETFSNPGHTETMNPADYVVHHQQGPGFLRSQLLAGGFLAQEELYPAQGQCPPLLRPAP